MYNSPPRLTQRHTQSPLWGPMGVNWRFLSKVQKLGSTGQDLTIPKRSERKLCAQDATSPPFLPPRSGIQEKPLVRGVHPPCRTQNHSAHCACTVMQLLFHGHSCRPLVPRLGNRSFALSLFTLSLFSKRATRSDLLFRSFQKERKRAIRSFALF